MLLILAGAPKQHARLAAASQLVEYQPQNRRAPDLGFRHCLRVDGGNRHGTGLIASRCQNRSAVCGYAVLARGSKSNGSRTMNNLSVGAIALAVALGTGAYLSDRAAAQQLQYACDENGDGVVDATESRMCTEREFDELAKGEEILTEEQLGQQGRTFSEVDENGDGEVSREEWARWHEQRFTAATQTGGSGIPAAEYDSMRWVTEGYTRPTPEAAGQKQQ
jgi:EF hand